MSNDEKGKGLTRREFAVGAGAAAGALAMAATTGTAFAAKDPNAFTVNIKLRRPITDAMRKSVFEELPLLKEVKDKDLMEKAVTAWCLSLCHTSTFNRVSEIPGMGFPGELELKKGTQATHLNGVAKWAIGMARDLKKWEPAVVINEDYVIVGALCHDLGKANELDPENIKRWEADPTQVGYQPMRHPIYGAAIALAAGLPEGVCHIVACHSAEGKQVIRSVECQLVVAADVAYWYMTSAVGMIKEKTIPIHGKFKPRNLDELIAHE